MTLGLSVSSVFEVVSAFVCCVGQEELSDCGADVVCVSCGGFPQEVLELREDLFDWVQIGRVFGQEQQSCASRADRLANGFGLVTCEVVHDDDIAGLECGQETPLHIEPEAFAVDGAVDEPGCVDAIMTQGRQEGHGSPLAVRHLGREPLAARRPAPERRHIGLGPGLVDEDQTLRRDGWAVFLPLRPPAPDVRAVTFTGDGGFF